jgi:hypothetical protein
MNVTSLARITYAECQKAWGGVTIDVRTNEFVYPTKGYAVKCLPEPTVVLPEDEESTYTVETKSAWDANKGKFTKVTVSVREAQ